MIDRRHLLWGANVWVSIRSWYHLVTLKVSSVIINHPATPQPIHSGKRKSWAVIETADQNPGLPKDRGLLYSSLTVSWTHAGVDEIMNGMDPKCHHAAKKLITEPIDRKVEQQHPHSSVSSSVYHLAMYFYHDKNQLCVFRVQFCALATAHNYLTKNFFLSYSQT